MDNNYRIVKTVESSGAGASSDMHEFKMTPFSNGTTVLMTVYQPRMYDLTNFERYGIKNGMGWIVEGVFQEVEIESGRVVFEWRSLDHMDPSTSWTYPGTTDTSGDGLHEDTPWDYFHINSIDKNVDGDYLISARHMSGIYKLSGVDGHIMWEMGGANPTFEQTNFNFSYQHHARWVSENDTHTLLSFYDNASNAWNSTNVFSHGWIISIDHIANTATMIKEWGAPEPEGGLLSASQGNLQLLPNGGCHIGWGEHAYFSEHTAQGSAVMYAKLADRASNVMIYRSYKANWTAQPLTKPALWTYSRRNLESDGMMFYVSWNGATEVRSWNFYTAQNASGPFTSVGNAKKTGFETAFHLANTTDWAYAEAVDEHGRPLDRSVIARTFVPSLSLRAFCDERGCGKAETFQVSTHESEEPGMQKQELLSTVRGFNTSHYYEDLPETRSAKSKSKLDIGTIIIAIGLFIMLFTACFCVFLYQRGAFSFLDPAVDAVQRQTIGLKDNVTRSAFGSKVFGKYSQVREKEMEGYDTGSSSSNNSA